MHAPALAAATARSSSRRLAARGAAIALAWLGGSVAATFPAMQVTTDALTGRGMEVGPALFAAMLACCGALGGALWGRALAAALGRRPLARRLAAGGALGFGGTLPLAMTALTRAETVLLVRAQAGQGLSMPLAFMALFPAVTALVVLAAVAAVGVAAGLGARAWRHAGRAAGTAAATFLAVAVSMHAAGWVVGAPGAEARMTMLVVTGLGLVAATLGAGARAAADLARALGARPAAPR